MSDLDRLAADLGAAADGVHRKAREVVERNATELRDQWRDNVRVTGRRHAVHYLKAVTAEQIPAADGIAWEVGPDSSMKQGAMSFEFGSSNQPPHLDGMRAAVQQEPKFIKDLKEITKDML